MYLEYKQIQEVLDSGDFSKLIGAFENEFLDVKAVPYDFSQVKNEFELCKDVSAFANNKGGFIVVGVVAEKSEVSPNEKILSVRGIKEADINIQQYVQYLNNGTYGNLASVCEFKFGKLDGKDVFYIHISDIADNKPYLVKKDKYFSYYFRTESNANPEAVDRIHETMRSGMQYEEYLSKIERRVEEISEMLQGGIFPSETEIDRLKKEL